MSNFQTMAPPVSQRELETEPDTALAEYEVKIGGKVFSIQSRHGEAHIREVERVIGETMGEIQNVLGTQKGPNIELLTALNLADQLVSLQTQRADEQQNLIVRLELMSEKLEGAVTSPKNPLSPPTEQDQ